MDFVTSLLVLAVMAVIIVPFALIARSATMENPEKSRDHGHGFEHGPRP